MKRTGRAGAVLIISAKPRILQKVRAALTPGYGRVLSAETAQEAEKAVLRERIAVILVFTPLKDEEELQHLLEMAERRMIAVALAVSSEVYEETAYRMEGRHVFVISYPIQMREVLQAAGFLYQVQERLLTLLSEQDRLKTELRDSRLISRVKCLLVEKRGLTEEAAHHLIEQKAMNAGIPKREAAEKLLAELLLPEGGSSGT